MGNPKWEEANKMQKEIGWQLFNRMAQIGFTTETAKFIRDEDLKKLLKDAEDRQLGHQVGYPSPNQSSTK